MNLEKSKSGESGRFSGSSGESMASTIRISDVLAHLTGQAAEGVSEGGGAIAQAQVELARQAGTTATDILTRTPLATLTTGIAAEAGRRLANIDGAMPGIDAARKAVEAPSHGVRIQYDLDPVQVPNKTDLPLWAKWTFSVTGVLVGVGGLTLAVVRILSP